MNNYNKFANQMKELIVDFGIQVSNRLSKPMRKFVIEMIFGIIASKSILLSEIARNLDEDITIKETDNRLSENLGNISDKLNLIWQNYHETIKYQIDENTIFNIDDSMLLNHMDLILNLHAKLLMVQVKIKRLKTVIQLPKLLC